MIKGLGDVKVVRIAAAFEHGAGQPRDRADPVGQEDARRREQRIPDGPVLGRCRPLGSAPCRERDNPPEPDDDRAVRFHVGGWHELDAALHLLDPEPGTVQARPPALPRQRLPICVSQHFLLRERERDRPLTTRSDRRAAGIPRAGEWRIPEIQAGREGLGGWRPDRISINPYLDPQGNVAGLRALPGKGHADSADVYLPAGSVPRSRNWALALADGHKRSGLVYTSDGRRLSQEGRLGQLPAP